MCQYNILCYEKSQKRKTKQGSHKVLWPKINWSYTAFTLLSITPWLVNVKFKKILSVCALATFIQANLSFSNFGKTIFWKSSYKMVKPIPHYEYRVKKVSLSLTFSFPEVLTFF